MNDFAIIDFALQNFNWRSVFKISVLIQRSPLCSRRLVPPTADLFAMVWRGRPTPCRGGTRSQETSPFPSETQTRSRVP